MESSNNNSIRQRNNQKLDDTLEPLENETITLSRSEYERLKSLESSANQYQGFKRTIIWLAIVLFAISLYIVIKTSDSGAQSSSLPYAAYYENDLERVRKEVDSNIGDDNPYRIRKNYRPGRLYHRGGNYGRKS